MFWEGDRRKSRNDCDTTLLDYDTMGGILFSVPSLSSSSSEATQWALRVEIILLCFIFLSRWLSFTSSLATAAECSAHSLTTTSRLDSSFLCAQFSDSREISTHRWPQQVHTAYFEEFFEESDITIQTMLKEKQWLQKMGEELSWMVMCLDRARQLMNFCFIASFLHFWWAVQNILSLI